MFLKQINSSSHLDMKLYESIIKVYKGKIVFNVTSLIFKCFKLFPLIYTSIYFYFIIIIIIITSKVSFSMKVVSENILSETTSLVYCP